MSGKIIALIIPVIVIFLAILTKRIIPSLAIGIILGGIFLAKGNIIKGLLETADHLLGAASGTDSLYIIFFLFLFGAFGEILKVSGGIKGFTKLSDRYVKTEKGALGAIYALTPVSFIDCCFHDIAAGTVGKALVDKVKGNRRKFAFILNVTSCLLIILIPFGTTYVGYIIGVISSALDKAKIAQPVYQVYLKSLPYNFYALVMIAISIIIILLNFGFKKAISVKKADAEDPHGADEAHEQCRFMERISPRPFNLILPLLLLIATTFFFLWYTGKSTGSSFFSAIANAEFEESIFISALVTILLTSVFYLFQAIPMNELESHFLKGGCEMMPPIIVLILSWGLASLISDLGFTDLMTGIIGPKIPVFLIPVMIYLIGCFASYFMGTAWGTWALLMPTAVLLATSAGANLPLVIGAVLAGGSLGDNASPLGETAILSSTIADIPLMEHVKSQLPYSIVGIIISSVLFVIFAII